MRKLFSVLFMFCFFNLLNAQETMGDVNKKVISIMKTQGYLPAVDYLKKSETKFGNNPQWSSYFYQIFATYNSFIGERQLSLKYYDFPFFEYLKKTKTLDSAKYNNLIDSLLIKHDVKPALNYIVNRAKSEKIIMINEVHHDPQTRILTHTLLKPLYEEGYKYLAVEALNQTKYSKSKRLNFESGFYIENPVFAELIREAQKIGYTIVGYDYSDCKHDKEKPNYCENNREIHQAVNIQQILQKDSSAKILVHAGYAHIYESTPSDWIKMAEFLTIISGINPFTIDQVEIRERSEEISNFLYKNLTKKIGVNYPSVFINKENDSCFAYHKELYDLTVVYPPVKMTNERSSYLFYRKGYKYYFLPKKWIKKGAIVQAFKSAKKEQVIPNDQFIVHNIENKNALILKHGNYNVVISTLNKVNNYNIKVK